MVREAEEYAEEDKAVKDRIDARNSLESYLYNMKNLLDDEEKGVSDKISEADKEVCGVNWIVSLRTTRLSSVLLCVSCWCVLGKTRQL